MTFVDPVLSTKFNPTGLEDRIWLGILSITTFFAGIFDLVAGWKGKASGHNDSKSFYFKIKMMCNDLLNDESSINSDNYSNLKKLYEMSDNYCLKIDDGKFLKLKRKHLVKVKVSKVLDDYPGAWVWLIKSKLIVSSSFNLFCKKSK
jgi:hypothetical protein